ncbi:DUF3072 domain-containing protein [Aquipuribacter hungaricus]|uniref:DUF3072 domain-containing protein n=1 Tax=Aquipuribacter hungaricus TaxID=545624 RepID=A0ABV7WKH9_9MICO
MTQTQDEDSTRGTDGTNDQAVGDSAEKPVEQWATGDEPATGPQMSYLTTLAREAGRDIPEGITKGDASLLIDELQQASGRGA